MTAPLAGTTLSDGCCRLQSSVASLFYEVHRQRRRIGVRIMAIFVGIDVCVQWQYRSTEYNEPNFVMLLSMTCA